ncbi:Gfo/Idh/MocA family protein [Kribbella sp. NPDC056951]|uniref:Gfo/Idh/MocA family protein n=1 Tax=Kribbella sp. NPDC056951 TaxID=3345978 RepID=UPI00363921BA
MRFAVVGAGAIGTVHARLLEALDDELVAVVDQDLERAQKLADQYGARASPDAASAYAEVDAVSICLPSALHADAAIEALYAGKHVLVEKPVDITLAAADRLIAAQRETGRTVSVVSQRRFQEPVVRIKEAVESGALGRITSGIVESAFYRPQSYYDGDGWRGTLAVDGGGALMNQGIHALDLLVWMLGRPVQVSAQTAQLAHQNLEVEDVAAATITFESGAIGLLLASTAAYPGRAVRLSIHGDQGIAVMDDDRLVALTTEGGEGVERHTSSRPGEGAAGGVGRGVAEAATPSGADGWGPVQLAHLAQYRDFVGAVVEGRAPGVGVADGRRALATVLAVYESARVGRPVEVDG